MRVAVECHARLTHTPGRVRGPEAAPDRRDPPEPTRWNAMTKVSLMAKLTAHEGKGAAANTTNR